MNQEGNGFAFGVDVLDGVREAALPGARVEPLFRVPRGDLDFWNRAGERDGVRIVLTEAREVDRFLFLGVDEILRSCLERRLAEEILRGVLLPERRRSRLIDLEKERDCFRSSLRRFSLKGVRDPDLLLLRVRSRLLSRGTCLTRSTPLDINL